MAFPLEASCGPSYELRAAAVVYRRGGGADEPIDLPPANGIGMGSPACSCSHRAACYADYESSVRTKLRRQRRYVWHPKDPWSAERLFLQGFHWFIGTPSACTKPFPKKRDM